MMVSVQFICVVSHLLLLCLCIVKKNVYSGKELEKLFFYTFSRIHDISRRFVSTQSLFCILFLNRLSSCHNFKNK